MLEALRTAKTQIVNGEKGPEAQEALLTVVDMSGFHHILKHALLLPDSDAAIADILKNTLHTEVSLENAVEEALKKGEDDLPNLAKLDAVNKNNIKFELLIQQLKASAQDEERKQCAHQITDLLLQEDEGKNTDLYALTMLTEAQFKEACHETDNAFSLIYGPNFKPKRATPKRKLTVEERADRLAAGIEKKTKIETESRRAFNEKIRGEFLPRVKAALTENYIEFLKDFKKAEGSFENQDNFFLNKIVETLQSAFPQHNKAIIIKIAKLAASEIDDPIDPKLVSIGQELIDSRVPKPQPGDSFSGEFGRALRVGLSNPANNLYPSQRTDARCTLQTLIVLFRHRTCQTERFLIATLICRYSSDFTPTLFERIMLNNMLSGLQSTHPQLFIDGTLPRKIGPSSARIP